MKERGIVTAADHGYFPGVQNLHASISGQAPLAVFDLGLAEDQLRWCKDNDVRVMPVDASRLPIPPPEEMWQSWAKPFFIDRSPHDLTLWLDADCQVVGDLSPLFAVIEREPLLVRHFWSLRNHPDRHWPINAGVLGFSKADRAGPLFREWCATVLRCAADLKGHGIPFHDEGSLIEAMKKVNGWRVQEREGWDRFVMNHRFGQPLPVEDGDAVHHFMGLKPWREDQFRQMRKYFIGIGHGSAERAQYKFSEWNWTRSEANDSWAPFWMDARHVHAIARAAMTGAFKKVLEVGCWNGSSTSALVHAARGTPLKIEVCDVDVRPSLLKVLKGSKAVIHQRTSLEVIKPGYDLLILDGDHSLGHVNEELKLFRDAGIPSLFAHDVGSEGRAGCEGAVYLGYHFRNQDEYQVLEDRLDRPGEHTHRGLLFATKDEAIFAKVKPVWDEVMRAPLEELLA